MNGLSIGRMVHFVNKEGHHRPAIVIEVVDQVKGVANLQVFNAKKRSVRNTSHEMKRKFSEEHLINTWHWMD